MTKRYNVYNETDIEAVKSAITNLGIDLDPASYGMRSRKPETAYQWVHYAMNILVDGLSEDECERALGEEVLTAKERLGVK